MLKFTAFLFGAVAYFTFLFTILFAIGFVPDLIVPKAIDTGCTLLRLSYVRGKSRPAK
ncbi:hypothetical protein JQ629_26220 [Bradyrhizobium sp. AUGA SZCCT0222]|uniref:hypothetical protein n=1 Tax=Bradyrhizobium sp. AUGA SZCCT0222 TaxID=2807668 RepID=UPI001BA7E586|nr:hypothetical protein [Bradyrhizobium sp. AUGA SZCCT0222]MBR1270977.1 hypothetical protein [Bradyrhizobium sp. AUGA SZCCT0222]